METQSIITLPDVTTANIKKAIESIKQYASQKNYVINGNIDALTNVTPKFSSKNQERKFRWAMLRVIKKPSMRNSNIFIHQLSKATGISKVKLDYSDREKQIQAARKEWKSLQATAEEARKKYKEIKGDFYKK